MACVHGRVHVDMAVYTAMSMWPVYTQATCLRAVYTACKCVHVDTTMYGRVRSRPHRRVDSRVHERTQS